MRARSDDFAALRATPVPVEQQRRDVYLWPSSGEEVLAAIRAHLAGGAVAP